MEKQITATKQQQYLFNLTELDKNLLIARKQLDDPCMSLYYGTLNDHEAEYRKEMGWA